MARNPVRHRGINTGLNRPRDRVWTPKRMISALHVDGGAAPGGDGSAAAPYDDFTEIIALGTALSGQTVRLARGSTIADKLELNSITDLVVEAYGSGAAPIIDPSVPIGGTWTAQAGIGPNVFSHSGTAQLHPVIDGVDMTFRSNETTGLLKDNTSWFGSPVAATLYVNTSAGDPDSATTVMHPGDTYCIIGTSCQRVTIRDIDFRGAQSNCVAFAGAGTEAITVSRSTISLTGEVTSPASSTDGIAISGGGVSDMADSCIVEDITVIGSDGHGSSNHAVEISFLTGYIIRRLVVSLISGRTIEWWNQCTDGLSEKILSYDTRGVPFNFFNQTGTHDGNVVRNAMVRSRANWASASNTQVVGMDANSNTNTKFINCSFSVDDQAPMKPQVGCTIDFINCISHMTKASGTGQSHIFVSGATSSIIDGTDYNRYSVDTASNNWQDSSGLKWNLADWRATAGNPDVNADTVGATPYDDIEAAVPDFGPADTPLAGMLPATDPDIPTDDYFGKARTTQTDVGAIQVT